MHRSAWAIAAGVVFGVLALLYGAVVFFFRTQQEAFLFLPTHEPATGELQPWQINGTIVGYFSAPAHPAAVLLALPGNHGQASTRSYYRSRMREEDALYVLDYPGYGQRLGQPTRTSIDSAGREALDELRRLYPATPIGVVGDSFGSGPACALAGSERPPDFLILAVPYDRLSRALQHNLSFVPWRWVLRHDWDNLSSLRQYTGPVAIYAAELDDAIPPDRARALAATVPQARFVLVAGGHGDWVKSPEVHLGPPR